MTHILTTKEAASYLSLAPQTLNKWRIKGEYIPFCKIGRRVAYVRADLDEFIEKSRISSTSAEAA